MGLCYSFLPNSPGKLEIRTNPDFNTLGPFFFRLEIQLIKMGRSQSALCTLCYSWILPGSNLGPHSCKPGPYAAELKPRLYSHFKSHSSASSCEKSWRASFLTPPSTTACGWSPTRAARSSHSSAESSSWCVCPMAQVLNAFWKITQTSSLALLLSQHFRKPLLLKISKTA